jgi:hypothetical protein
MVFVSSILTLQQKIYKIMKFTYTHITENYTEKIEYKITKNNKVITKQIRHKSDNINVKNII